MPNMQSSLSNHLPESTPLPLPRARVVGVSGTDKFTELGVLWNYWIDDPLYLSLGVRNDSLVFGLVDPLHGIDETEVTPPPSHQWMDPQLVLKEYDPAFLNAGRFAAHLYVDHDYQGFARHRLQVELAGVSVIPDGAYTLLNFSEPYNVIAIGHTEYGQQITAFQQPEEGGCVIYTDHGGREITDRWTPAKGSYIGGLSSILLAEMPATVAVTAHTNNDFFVSRETFPLDNTPSIRDTAKFQLASIATVIDSKVEIDLSLDLHGVALGKANDTYIMSVLRLHGNNFEPIVRPFQFKLPVEDVPLNSEVQLHMGNSQLQWAHDYTNYFLTVKNDETTEAFHVRLPYDDSEDAVFTKLYGGDLDVHSVATCARTGHFLPVAAVSGQQGAGIVIDLEHEGCEIASKSLEVQPAAYNLDIVPDGGSCGNDIGISQGFLEFGVSFGLREEHDWCACQSESVDQPSKQESLKSDNTSVKSAQFGKNSASLFARTAKEQGPRVEYDLRCSAGSGLDSPLDCSVVSKPARLPVI